MKTFPIDFIRQIVEQTLIEEKIKNPMYIGGPNQVNLFSFYEQLVQENDVDRFTEMYRDLVEQQNRSGLIANGVIVAPENPTITNLNQCLIVPMTFTITFRCTTADRDLVLESLNNLISVLKGRKVDIAELNDGQLFKVGTFGNNVNGTPAIRNGDYLGDNITNIATRLTNLGILGFSVPTAAKGNYYYTSKDGAIVTYVYNGSAYELSYKDGTYADVIYPPTHSSFTKYKVSLSFDSIRCDEPRTLSAEEYCNLSIGGSATLCNASVLLGNDLLKLGINKNKVKGTPTYTYTNPTKYWLEPLEMPSSNNANTKANQLLSNAFKTNSHTDALNLTLQYTFILDTSIGLLNELYEYGRYGIQATFSSTTLIGDGISPNLIFDIVEIYNTWGSCNVRQFKTKIIESVDIENTESDVLTISTTMQIQGDND